MKGPAPVLHWFTSDLRLRDNPALAIAARPGPVAGVFVRERRMLCPDYPPPVIEPDAARARVMAALADAAAPRRRA